METAGARAVGHAIVSLALAAVAGCAPSPASTEMGSLLHACDIRRDADACRQLTSSLKGGYVPRAMTPSAEEAVSRACWSDALVDARLGTDTRYRLCYDLARHYTTRAATTLEEPETRYRKIAARLYLRSCELGQLQACRLVLSECLLLEDDICREPPSDEQALRWNAERRARDVEALRAHAR